MGNFKLPEPARYFPFEKGVYEVAPALKTFGTPFGNGDLDSRIFQCDSSFETFRQSKLACRADRLSKYYREKDYSPAVASGVARLIVSRLLEESPLLFSYEQLPTGESALFCRLTGETLRFGPGMELLSGGYESAFDALAMQVAEDLNVISVDDSGGDWLSAIHVCSPSTWRPEEKVGKSFIGIHSPVPTSEAMLRASKGIVNAMIHKGPYVRFNWGLTTNPQPNHYPDPPPGISYEQWRGKPVSAIGDTVDGYVWVERQIVWGCPEASASLFTIRVSFVPLREIRDQPERAAQLSATLRSMAPTVREYKGLEDCIDSIAGWLSG